MRSNGAPAACASASSCERWSIAKANTVCGAGRRVVAQCTWLIAASWRSVRARLPCRRKYCSSVQVGLSGEHSRRDTANAPQALAYSQHVSSGASRSQPRRKPDMNASPAPSTL